MVNINHMVDEACPWCSKLMHNILSQRGKMCFYMIVSFSRIWVTIRHIDRLGVRKASEHSRFVNLAKIGLDYHINTENTLIPAAKI